MFKYIRHKPSCRNMMKFGDGWPNLLKPLELLGFVCIKLYLLGPKLNEAFC